MSDIVAPVLIISADPALAGGLSARLGDTGLTAVVAGAADHVTVEAVFKAAPSAIILDHAVSGSVGEFVSIVRMHPATATVPIVMLVPLIAPADRREAQIQKLDGLFVRAPAAAGAIVARTGQLARRHQRRPPAPTP